MLLKRCTLSCYRDIILFDKVLCTAKKGYINDGSGGLCWEHLLSLTDKLDFGYCTLVPRRQNQISPRRGSSCVLSRN